MFVSTWVTKWKASSINKYFKYLLSQSDARESRNPDYIFYIFYNTHQYFLHKINNVVNIDNNTDSIDRVKFL